MNKRIKEIRKHFNLTQEDFAAKIGSQRATIANYENGRRMPVNSVISLICTKFNINEEWLRTGKGDMIYIRNRAEVITDFMNDLLTNKEFEYKAEIIEILANTSKEQWLVLLELSERIASLPAVQKLLNENRKKGKK